MLRKVPYSCGNMPDAIDLPNKAVEPDVIS